MPESPRFNPFQSPTTVDEDRNYINSEVVQSLRRTRPWVLFLAIVGVICVAFMLFGMIGIMLNAPATAATPGLPAGFATALTLFYAAMIALCVVPLIFMFKYASRIRRLVTTGSVNSLQAALEAQKSLWKSIGIAMIVSIVLYIVFMVMIVAYAALPTPNQAGPASTPLPAPVKVVE